MQKCVQSQNWSHQSKINLKQELKIPTIKSLAKNSFVRPLAILIMHFMKFTKFSEIPVRNGCTSSSMKYVSFYIILVNPLKNLNPNLSHMVKLLEIKKQRLIGPNSKKWALRRRLDLFGQQHQIMLSLVDNFPKVITHMLMHESRSLFAKVTMNCWVLIIPYESFISCKWD